MNKPDLSSQGKRLEYWVLRQFRDPDSKNPEWGAKSRAAEALGISSQQLGAYMRDEKDPSGEIIKRFREKLGISPTWYLTGEGPMEAREEPERLEGKEQGEIDVLASAAGQRLKRVREELGLTVTELGEAAGMTDGAISDIELGRCWPSGELLFYLAAHRRVREAYILRGEGEMFTPPFEAEPISLTQEEIDALPRFPSWETPEGAAKFLEWIESIPTKQDIDQMAEKAAEKAVEKYREQEGDKEDKDG